jgi:AcrR family transcriptional regulator
MARDSIRMSAEERRESVIRAAVAEFARGGYEGTSTAAIARRVGVSQPYLFRLFPDKRAIFLAAALRCTAEIRRRMERASEGLSPAEAKEAMADAYSQLIADRDLLMFQMQMYAAAGVAVERGDERFAAELRAGWAELWDMVQSRLGGDEVRTADFFGTGMLINTLVSLGFEEGHRIWSACHEKRLPPPSGGSSITGPDG